MRSFSKAAVKRIVLTLGLLGSLLYMKPEQPLRFNPPDLRLAQFFPFPGPGTKGTGAFSPIRILSGTSSSYGTPPNEWTGDIVAGHFFSSGSGTFSSGSPIDNTTDDAIYQNERYWSGGSASGDYIFNLPNGTYQVTLKFCEFYYGTNGLGGTGGVGSRVFDVSLNGTLVDDNFDTLAHTSPTGYALYAVDRVYTNVVISGGTLTVNIAGADPKVNAIEVIVQP